MERRCCPYAYEEKDEPVQQLLSVEDPANPTEIVIHVNMLKEGWDVTNLYTIVPLRAANSKTLVEPELSLHESGCQEEKLSPDPLVAVFEV